MTFLRSLLVLLVVTMAHLYAVPPTPVSYGDGFRLINANDDTEYFAVNPGLGDAGLNSNNPSKNIFQLFGENGSNPGGHITYGAPATIQLASSNFWLTLNPATPFPSDIPAMPYIRNNAPLPLQWEQLHFIPLAEESGDMYYGDQVLLARNSDEGVVYIMLTDSTASTTSDFNAATPMIINQVSDFTPYSQQSNGNSPVKYGYYFILNCSINNVQLWFNINSGQDNAGFINDTGTYLQIATTNGDTSMGSSLSYGQPVSLIPHDSSSYVTLNIPSPYSSGYVRNNAPTTDGGENLIPPGVWEQLYFISVNGRNGDLMYDQDQLYIARNGLIGGNFATEYVAIDNSGNVSTTFDVLIATPFTMNVA